MLNFDVAPFYDDTVQTAIPNNYMRILFRPSYAVQARELTALQSILQNQVSSLGDYVFQDGSPVTGGHISIDTTVYALQLQSQYANVDISLSDFFVNNEPTLIINASGAATIKAYVVAIDTTQQNSVILVKYLTSTMFSSGDVIQVATGVQSQAQLVTSNAVSVASTASINDGIFYSGGFFVTVLPQTIVLDSTTNTPTYRIGLEISESIIDEVTDSTLLDPAQGSFNYQAPGAERYQYALQLSKRTLSSIDDSAFYELVRIENGVITSRVDYPVFGDLDKALARRTYDTSGDFVVTPFTITAGLNALNTQQYQVSVSPGKAFVKGFEYETISNKLIYGNRALTTGNVSGYGMTLQFGDILTVANIYSGTTSGIFDVENFITTDLHCINSGSLNTASSVGYNSTKIGTTKVRDIEYLGLGDYYAYILDTNLVANTFTATGGSLTSVTLTANHSTVSNAYQNVSITVVTGPYTDTKIITAYNGSTKVATLDSPLKTAATSSSQCTLNYAIKDLNSLVVPPASFGGNLYYTQNSSSGIYACMDIANAGKDITGNTILADTQFNKLIYPLPQVYVSQGSIANASFYARKNLWSQTFSSANLTISSGSGLGTGESFPYGYTNSYLTDQAANTNFFVVVRNNLSSNLTNGQVIIFNQNSLSPGIQGNGVYQTDSTHVTIATSSNNTFVGDVLFTVEVSSAAQSSVARRTKTLVGNSANTSLLSTDSYLNGTAIIGTANANSVYLDTANGYLWFTNYNDIPKTAETQLSMYVPDIIGITKIYDSGNASFAPNSTNAIDITNNYEFNSGQNDNYYDFGFIRLLPGSTPPQGQTMIMLQYYSHDTVQGFFDADSYSANSYQNELIPYYNSPKFGMISLRDSIDFRPTRQLGSAANVQSFTLYGIKIPQPDGVMQLDYNYYLPRIDKLLLNKSGVFTLYEGTPGQYPLPPADSDDSMTLYILNIPAYTANAQQISMQYVENKRYTMKEIGALDTRIQQLEYYSSLSQLESQATSEKIMYQDNITSKDIYGIIADDFGSFSIADTSNPDLRCYIIQGSMSPMKDQLHIPLTFAANTGGAISENKSTYTLGYTEVPAVVQNTATSNISVQPFLFAQFTGTVKITPATDPWYSSNITPQIIKSPGTTVSVPPTSPAQTAPAITSSPVVTVPAPIITGTATNTPTSSYYYVGGIRNLIGYNDYWGYYGVYGPAGYKYGMRRSYAPYSIVGEVIEVTHNTNGTISTIYHWFGSKAHGSTTTTAYPPTLPPGAKQITAAVASGLLNNNTTYTPVKV